MVDQKRNQKKAGVFLVAIMCLFGVTSSFADIIHFSDEQQVKGVITEETEDTVVISMDVGTMIFPKSSIAKIEKGTDVGISKKVVPAPLAPAQGGGEIRDAGDGIEESYADFRQYMQNRWNALEVRRVRDKLYQRFIDLEAGYDDYGDRYRAMEMKAEELRAVGNARGYNNAFIQMGNIQAKRLKLIKVAFNVIVERMKQEQALFNLLQDASHNRQLFKEHFAKIKKKGLTSADAYYFEELKKESEEIQSTLEAMTIKYEEDPEGLIVKGVVNGAIKTSFLFDKTAPFVILSKDFAESLPLRIPFGLENVNLTAIKGLPFYYIPVFLDSVKVGTVEVKNVTALIASNFSYIGVDGVLGIPFMSNYAVQVNKGEKKIILYDIIPQA